MTSNVRTLEPAVEAIAGPRTYLNYIGGDWVAGGNGKSFEMINPANQQVIGSAQQSNESDMERAIEAAVAAFEGSPWRLDSALRARALSEYACLLAARKEGLARLLTLNNGKPIRESRLEIDSCIDLTQYTAGLARNVFGRSIAPSESSLSVIIREPIGVVGIIVPWNWPLQLLLREMIPALASGNAVVVKPASNTAAVSMEVMQILSEIAAFPKGIVNAVTGPGSAAGAMLAASDKVGMVSFTGDNSTGQTITKLAARSVKKVNLELGGKSPNVLFGDADLDKAIPAAVNAVFLTAGQVCMAGTRLVVEETIFKEVARRIKELTEKLNVCNGLEETCDMGPVVSRSQMDSVLGYIELGKKEGTLITGGYALSGPRHERGFFIAPTIFSDLPRNSRLVQEEIFGPVLVMQKFRTEAEAVEIANDTRFGLAAAVWTADIKRAMRVSRSIRAGTVWVNTYFKLYNQAEFGGFKASGIGRTRGIEGLYEFTEMKHINFEMQ